MMYNFNQNIEPLKIKAVFSFLFSLILIFTSHYAYADAEDTINFVAGISQQHDDNLFRQSSSPQSDNITAAYAGIRLDKQYSLQRFKLDLTDTDYRYSKNDFLNFNSVDYKVAWLWSLTPHLVGSLTVDSKKQLNDFKDYTNFVAQNIRTTRSQHFDADYSPYGNWHALAGFTHTQQKNSQTFNEESDFTMSSVDAGMKYVFASGSAFTFLGHHRNGDYTNRILNASSLLDTAFDESELEAKFDWMLSGKSKVLLRLSNVNRDHEHFSQRDYSGMQGRAEYIWSPLGKLQLSMAAQRQMSSYQTSTDSYTRTDTVSLNPIYAITPKITARANASYGERKFLGQSALPSLGRLDKERLFGLSVDWSPYRSLSLGVNAQYSSRNSNITSNLLNYRDLSAGLSANVNF